MGTTRRRFLGVSGSIAAFFLQPVRAFGQASPAPSASPTPAPEAKPETLARAAKERYGRFLTPEEQKTLDEKMAGVERRGSRLRSFKLGNGEEPATEFRTVRP